MSDRCPRCTAAGALKNASNPRRCQFVLSTTPSPSPHWRSTGAYSWNCETINRLRELAGDDRLVWSGGQWSMLLPVSDEFTYDFLIVAGYKRRGGIEGLWAFSEMSQPVPPGLDVVEDVIAGLEATRADNLALIQAVYGSDAVDEALSPADQDFAHRWNRAVSIDVARAVLGDDAHRRAHALRRKGADLKRFPPFDETPTPNGD